MPKTKKDETGTVSIIVKLDGAKKNRSRIFKVNRAKVSAIVARIGKLLGEPIIVDDVATGKPVIRYEL